MRVLLIIALVIGVIAVVANDGGRYSNAKYDLGTVTERVADDVANAARGNTREQSAALAAKLAQPDGVRVYQFGQDDQGIQVWTETTVPGTWVLGPFLAWRSGKPLDTPLVVRDYAAAVYR